MGKTGLTDREDNCFNMKFWQKNYNQLSIESFDKLQNIVDNLFKLLVFQVENAKYFILNFITILF